jgi:hypothetical protein
MNYLDTRYLTAIRSGTAMYIGGGGFGPPVGAGVVGPSSVTIFREF